MALPISPQAAILIASALGFGGSFLFRDNRAKDLLRMIQEETSPEKIAQLTDQLVQRLRQSPAFAQGQREAIGAGARAEEMAASSVARGGVRTGTGVLGQAAAAGVTGSALSQLELGLLLRALETAQGIAGARASALAGAPQPRNMPAEIYGGAVGALGQLAALTKAQPTQPTPTPTNLRMPRPGAAPPSLAGSAMDLVRPGTSMLGMENPFVRDYFSVLRGMSLGGI